MHQTKDLPSYTNDSRENVDIIRKLYASQATLNLNCTTTETGFYMSKIPKATRLV